MQTRLSTPNATFTLGDFLHGRPEAILEAHKSPKILIVWPHGNEELGPRFGYHLYTERPDLLAHVDYLCGNPRAAAQNPPANYIDADLNRSFRPHHAPSTYEERRAAEIRSLMQTGGYDYILVLHTSVTDTGKFLILGAVTPEASTIIAASEFDRIVVMPTIIDLSVSGQSPKAIEFEMNEAIAEKPETMEEFSRLIERLVGLADARPPKNREIFYVDRAVPKAEDPGIHVQNFVKCEAGYYPVLMGTGKHSYRENPAKTYVGFAATRKDTLEL